MNIEGEIVSNTLYIAPFNKYYKWTVDHTLGSSSKYMTTFYNYFCKKMTFLDFLKVKKLWKYAPKRTKLRHSKIFFRGSMPPNPPSKRMATPRVTSPPPQKKIVGPHLQILHTPMNYYWEIYLKIHPGKQLIVCSTLYVYALQNLFRGQIMTKIVAQHILKCITWALFSNTMWLCVHNINV